MNPTLTGFIRKELAQTLRDPRMRVILFVAPVVQLVIFGLAISTEVKNIKLAVYADGLDRVARRLADRCFSTDLFIPVRGGSDPFETIRAGKADVALVAPSGGLTEQVERGHAKLQLLVDASNAVRARAVDAYVRAILPQVIAETKGTLGPPGGISMDVRLLYNPAMDTSIFIVPGIVCMLLTLASLILTSSSIAREKEMGTFETILAAPVATWEVLVGKTLPYALIAFADVPIILTIAVLLFGLPIRGPYWMLALASLVYIVTMVNAGTLISTITKNQQQAMMGSFLFLFPSQLLSGIFYPLDNMPWAIRWVTYLNPMRYFVSLLRNVLLKGGDPTVFWVNLSALLVLSSIAVWLSFTRFHQTLD